MYLSWEPPDVQTDVAGYKLYAGITYLSVANKEFIPIDIGKRLSFCLEIADGLMGVFFAVVSYDERGIDSVPSNIVYMLVGNIQGDCNSKNNCTPYQEARVDGQDLAVLGQYWRQTVTHQNINCSKEFIVEIPSLKQKADLNKDGRIDGRDLSILGQRWWETMPP